MGFSGSNLLIGFTGYLEFLLYNDVKQSFAPLAYLAHFKDVQNYILMCSYIYKIDPLKSKIISAPRAFITNITTFIIICLQLCKYAT